MELSGAGKSPITNFAFRYNANNEKLEELFNDCDDNPSTPLNEPLSNKQSENPSPKRGDKTPSIIDKYFKSIRTEKVADKEKIEDTKNTDPKTIEKDEACGSSTPKEISSSPMKEYLNRLGKRSTPEVPEVREGSNETWKIFHDFRYKIAQAVEDMKTRSIEETREKSVPRENSTSDSEENSAVKDVDQQSVGDTDNQVSSLDSSIQNLSEISQATTAKAADKEVSLPADSKNSESSDDTHKNLAHSDMAEDYLSDSLMDVESGVEALEDTMDAFVGIADVPPDISNDKPIEQTPSQPCLVPTSFGIPPSETNLKEKTNETQPKKNILNFTMYFLTIFLIINIVLFPKAYIWIGFLMGICFFYFASHLKEWFMDNFLTIDGEPRKSCRFFQVKRSSATPLTYTIPSVMEHSPLKKYEGWINHYRFPDYDPFTYHINKTTTAFIKLEGCNLRLSYTKTKIAKRELWDEKIEKVSFYQHRLYNLKGARVILLPNGLVKRRLWSKKYPICVILCEKEKIQVLERESASTERRTSEAAVDKNKKEQLSQHESEGTETNTSPEKKKKFVWRKKEKSVTAHSEGEPGKEGLRHRLVRKMHREDDNIEEEEEEEDEEDKKTDSVSTSTARETLHPSPEKSVQFDDAAPGEPPAAPAAPAPAPAPAAGEEGEEELDETEMSNIKEFLEETELETNVEGPLEGEWSVHVKHSTNRQHLYLFARTGRDKHEWYRRFVTAITDANASADSSAADDKSASAADSKDATESAVYRAEKDAVAFAKNTNKLSETTVDSVTVTSPPPLSHGCCGSQDTENYEKNFWPYFLKIIQTHEKTCKQTSEVGVMCLLEPSPHERSKNKKKKKNDTKAQSPDCDCRLLPSEVTWVNAVLARLMFDVMHDPALISRLQARIQKKLHTLKLPSFMSPLVVTQLSLAGACPRVARVAGAADARGVWLDAELRYGGGAYIALQTQINLMKLKEKNMTLEDQLLATSEYIVENEVSSGSISEQIKNRKPAIYDDEVEDSAESSSDDDSAPAPPADSAPHAPPADSSSTVSGGEGGSSKKKFLRMVDKIATNKYFQQVTDYKYVKRAMEGLSNTDIKLHLEIHGLEGMLALNLPPPPHDRLWIGFRTNPVLVLKARPAVGARTLRFAHVSNWIEQKLSKEFEKILVLPNMEDFIIDIMTPTPVHYE